MATLWRQVVYALTKRATLLIVLSFASTALMLGLSEVPASADNGSYPYPTAPCAWNGNTTGSCSGYDWGESTCPSGDSYCTTGNEINGYYIYDTLSYGFRNCTDYAAGKLEQVYGMSPSKLENWGYAYQWNSKTPYTVESPSSYTPEVGDIAEWGSTMNDPDGHVAYVYAVSSSGVPTFAEYNQSTVGTFSASNTPSQEGTPTYYIHISSPPNPHFPYEAAFAAAGTGYMYPYSSATGNATPTTQGLASGTSPAVADGSDGYMVAFHGGNGDLFTYDVATGAITDTAQGMASGTSPGIAAAPNGGYEIAFVANTGYLYTYSFTDNSSSTTPTTLGVASGTSPAITYVSGGYEEAFNANGGNLYVNGSNSSGSTSQGMVSGTSPSISAPVNGSSFEAAFDANANGGELYIYNSSGPSTTPSTLGITPGTSPSITALASGGYEEAFNANGGNMYVNGSNSSGSTGLGMESGTSPVISAFADGSSNFEGVFQANTGYMWVYSSATGQGSATSQGLVSSSNPTVTAQ